MKTFAQVVAVLAVMALVGVAWGKEAGAAKDGVKKAPAKINGVVVKVEGTNLVIKQGKAGKEVTVATDASTEVKIEGKAAKLDDLKQGMKVSISPATGTAKKIEVPAPKAPKQK